MKNKQRTYTLWAALLVVLAVLLPVIGTMVTGHAFDADYAAGSQDEDALWPAFFAAVLVAIIMLSTLLVTCLLSCVSAGIAIRLASSAVAIAREQGTASILPRILRVTAIIELVAAILVELFPLILLLRFQAL